MNIKRYLISVLFVFVALFGYEFVLHGILLKEAYENTSHLWRPVAEMSDLFHFTLISYLALALVVTYLFTLKYEEKGLAEGMRFGSYIGLIIGILAFSSYVYLKAFPLTLALSLLVGGVVEGIVLGLVLALTYRK